MTQPVDWPDWLQLPAYTTQFFNVVAVAAPLATIVEANTGYFQHALVVLAADGDGSDWSVALQQFSANPLEGGSLMWQNVVTRVFPLAIVVPMTVAGTFLRIVDVEASAYPHNAIGYISLFSARGFMTGYPGGTYVINEQQTITGTLSSFFLPLGCGPGAHAISVSTAALNWDLFLRVWIDSATAVDYPLVLGTSGSLIALPFAPPASAWELMVGNNDVTDQSFAVLVTRQP